MLIPATLDLLKRLKSKPGVVAWCLYDWAISSFSSVITTFIFATYFTQKIAENKILGTHQWGNAIALASFIVAVSSPIFGAIADHEGRRKPWLAVFTYLIAVSSALLWFAKPAPAYINWALTWVVLGTIGMGVSTVFYNAMMRGLVSSQYLGRISGLSWGLGYLGGLMCLVIVLFGFVEGHIPGLRLDSSMLEQVRIGGPLVGLWVIVFSLPLFLITPDHPATGVKLKLAIHQGIKSLWNTLKHLPKHRTIFRFLIAQMIYIDGLNTLFAFGGIYAAGTFGMSLTEVIQFGIAMNVTSGLGAISFGWLDDFLGPKRTILISLVAMILAGSALLFIESKTAFWVLALFLCIFIGPAQAASRTFMSRIVPPHLSNELFGLYALSGKATAFIGPWLLGLGTYLFNSQRVGMGVIILFFIAGVLLLSRVPSAK